MFATRAGICANVVILMNDPQFTTKRGTLTAYALMCGYIQRRELGNNSVTLGGHGAGNYYPYYVTVASSAGIVSHECYLTLLEARRAYATFIKELTTVSA
jgi:hypothetical protein